MTDRKLGRRPPSNKPAIMLADVLAAVPTHPGQVDYLAQVDDWGLYANDRVGDCGTASVANSLKLVTETAGDEVSVTLDDVFDLYRRSGNPTFDPETGAGDDGVVMQDMLDALLKGGIGGRSPLAFAKVDVRNLDEVRAAVAYFGFVLLGVNLDVGQQDDSDAGGVWDYEPSPEWGRHAIVAGKYTSQNGPGIPDFSGVSWGEVIGVTDLFCARQLEEAWVVVWPEHLQREQFRAGVDVAALAHAYTALTGRIFPSPPAPDPDPTPAPEPGAAPFLGADPAVAARLVALAARRHMNTSEYLNFLLTRLFLLPLGEAGDEIVQVIEGQDDNWSTDA